MNETELLEQLVRRGQQLLTLTRRGQWDQWAAVARQTERLARRYAARGSRRKDPGSAVLVGRLRGLHRQIVAELERQRQHARNELARIRRLRETRRRYSRNGPHTPPTHFGIRC